MPFLGAVEYHFVTDGISWSDGGGAFGLVPKVIWEKRLPPDDYNRVPLHLHCLLLKADGKTILVDTGLGNRLSPKEAQIFGLERSKGGLIENLARLDLTPADIDIVINTHLHADHCSGNTIVNPETGQIVPVFPNAEYWIQRLEWADATYPNERTQGTYLSDNYAVLAETGQLKLLNGDTPVVPGVSTVVTPGHTRSHQGILLDSDGELGLYVGDLATLHFHFERTAWVTGYDVEPLISIETKRNWQHWAVRTGALIMFEHDPHLHSGRLHPDGRHFKLEPVQLV